MSSSLPESLRRILAAQKAKPASPADSLARVLANRAERPGDVTTIWRDGEVWRETPDGKLRQLPPITPIP